MKPDAYLWQLTLNTGHTERRYRYEIEDHEFDAIRAMNPLKDGLAHSSRWRRLLFTNADRPRSRSHYLYSFGENTNHRARTSERADCHLHPCEP